MLLDLILGGDVRALLIGVLLGIPAVVICLSFHEAAHGFAAYLMGDRTAQASGRLTLDPLAHIDPGDLYVCFCSASAGRDLFRSISPTLKIAVSGWGHRSRRSDLEFHSRFYRLFHRGIHRVQILSAFQFHADSVHVFLLYWFAFDWSCRV